MNKKEKYIMTEEELQKVQEIEMELLREVDRICRKCNIHYNMVGGTMLGAIRHGGYIPWDDDADLGFLRTEYEKFREACKTELDTKRFYFQEIRDTEGYRWGYAKLRRKETQFVRLDQENMPYEQGIFIDLFPMDNVPDHKISRKIHFGLCFMLRKFLWSEIGCKVEKKFFVKLLYNIMKLVPKKILVIWYQCMIAATSHRKTKMVRILTFPTPKGTYGFDRKWFIDQERYIFGSVSLTGAKDYNGYLRHKFGNYMELPSEEERKTHPISKLKLL